MDIVVADPAKNITVFVLDEIRDREKRAETARTLLADPRFKAEQVGFVLPPPGGKAGRRLWRLEMMGGEFCGNAARSFGLFIARETGLHGRIPVTVEISGMDTPLVVTADTEAGTAEVEIPKPLAMDRVEIHGGKMEGRAFPLVIFDGIVHAIAPDTKPEEKTFRLIKTAVEKRCRDLAGPEQEGRPGAIGVMFFDTESRFMTPAVYVAATDSLVFESSCGSGSAALAAWKTRGSGAGESRLEVRQPGGVIGVTVCRQNGEIARIRIGGPVQLSGKILV
jgi:diaminopimelate epimerase